MNINTKKIIIKTPSKKTSKKKSYNNRMYPQKSPNSKINNVNRKIPLKKGSDNEKKKSKSKFEDVCLGQQVIKSPKSNTYNGISDNLQVKDSQKVGGYNIKKNIGQTSIQKTSPNMNNDIRKSSKEQIRKQENRSPKNELQKSPRKESQKSPKKEVQKSPRKELQKSPKKELQKSPKKELQKSPRSKKNVLGKSNPINNQNITKKEYRNNVTKHRQTILDKYYAQGKEEKIPKKTPKVKNIIKPIKKVETVVDTHKKVFIKTNIEFFRKPEVFLNHTLLENNIKNIDFYNNLKNPEDRYLAILITDGININKTG